jgi:predicted transcriptional regulator
MTERAEDILGPLEGRVMAFLWGTGPSSVGEVVGALNTQGGTPLAYTTVMTILGRLFGKGYVTRTKQGRSFRYAAAVDASAIGELAARRELERLVERYGPATVAEFAADLAGIDPEVTRRLRELAERGHERRGSGTS